MKNLLNLIAVTVLIFSTTSCEKDDKPTFHYPSTYALDWNSKVIFIDDLLELQKHYDLIDNQIKAHSEQPIT